jgi:hypothetical protein
MHQVAIQEHITLGAAVIEVNCVALVIEDGHHFIGAEHVVYLLSFRMVIVYNRKVKKSNLKLSVEQIKV